MAIYAIGDIQGCFDDLQRLLVKIKFDKTQDTLWFAGDLVNRGPKSLETLRFIKSLGKAAVCVLGNHDLHLLATAYGFAPKKNKDTLKAILEAEDREELLSWLRHQPLFHYNQYYCLIHAGLPPQWDFLMAKTMSLKIEGLLQGEHYLDFFAAMYGNQPDQWSEYLPEKDKIRFAVNCFTRLRFCDESGKLDFKHNGELGSQPKHLLPWFRVPHRKSLGLHIVFGHWSALGYHEENNCYAIDTGCLWGGQLTALKLAKVPQRISIDCAGYRKPKL